MNRVHS